MTMTTPHSELSAHEQSAEGVPRALRNRMSSTATQKCAVAPSMAAFNPGG